MGRYSDDTDVLPVGSLVEMSCTAPVVGDYVKAGSVLRKTDWPALAAGFNGIDNYEGLNNSVSPSSATGSPRYPFVFGGNTYYSSSGTGFYQLYDTDKLKTVDTTGLPGSAGRVAVLDGVAYCVSNNTLYKSTDVVKWAVVSDNAWYMPSELMGVTATDLYFRALESGNATARTWKMNATTKAFTYLVLPTGMTYDTPIYPDGNVLVSVTTFGTTPYIKVSRDAGSTWEDFKALAGHSYCLTKFDDGTVFVGNTTGAIASQAACHLSNDNWVTSFLWNYGVNHAQSVCKVGSKFALLVSQHSGAVVRILSVAAASTGTVASLATDILGSPATWADELGVTAPTVLLTINGKVSISVPEALISFPTGAGNILAAAAVSGRTVRPLPYSSIAVLWDGRVLSNGAGFLSVYDPTTGVISGPGRRVTNSTHYASAAVIASSLRGVALLGDEIVIYTSATGGGGPFALDYVVITAAGALQVGVTTGSAGSVIPNTMFVHQVAADALVTYCTAARAGNNGIYTSQNGRYFTMAVTPTLPKFTGMAITRSNYLVYFAATGSLTYVSKDLGKTWNSFPLTYTALYAITDEGIVLQPAAGRVALCSLADGSQIGADLPTDYWQTAADQVRFLEYKDGLNAGIANSAFSLINQRVIDASVTGLSNNLDNSHFSSKYTESGDLRAVLLSYTGNYVSYISSRQNRAVDRATEFKVPAAMAKNSRLNTYVKGR